MCTQFKKTSHPSTICVPCELPQLPDPTQVSELPTRTGLEERYGARLTKHPNFLPQTSRNYDKLVTCLYQVGHFGKRVWYLGCDLHKGIVKNVIQSDIWRQLHNFQQVLSFFFRFFHFNLLTFTKVFLFHLCKVGTTRFCLQVLTTGKSEKSHIQIYNE